MRLNQTIHNIVRSGVMIGDSKPCGRVTIEPDWTLKSTDPVYDGSVRGPFRYWQDSANNQVEIELPNIKSIQIDRSVSQDISTCNIMMYNQWHYSNSGATGLMFPELPGQLGKPGYFWPKRGQSPESQALWNQQPAHGATLKDGSYDIDFDWTNVIVPNALIRTYQGYGGNSVSIDQAIDNENIMITGAWLIDSISGGTDGMLNIQCRDVGRLLLEQITYPPLVPQTLYPIEYRASGVSAFDSTFGPDPKGSFNASFGEVRALYKDSATDDIYGSYDYSIFGHKGSNASDGNTKTYALSPAKQEPMGNNDDGYFWWEFDVEKTGGRGRRIQGLSFTPWGGGYTAYISIKYNGNWFGTETVPAHGGAIPYVKKVQIPLMLPDGNEREISVDFGVANPAELEAAVLRDFGSYWYKADEIRITLGDPLIYSGMADGSGYNYRCGLKDIVFRAVGYKTSEYMASFDELPWTFAMEAHPVRGYWVCEANGYVHGFGDAADYDSTAFGPVNFASPPFAAGTSGVNYTAGVGGAYIKPAACSMAAHPSGEGYWVLDPTGRVYAFGEATYYGQYTVPWRGENFALIGVTAMNIAATYTGNGYWVIYSDGSIRGFGDATPTFSQTPYTIVTTGMVNSGKVYKYIYGVPFSTSPLGFLVGQQPSTAYQWARRGTAIASHPTKMGFWASDGSGQVWAFGDATNYDGLIGRIYNKNGADSFHLAYGTWCHGMTATKTGEGYWLAFADGHIAAFGDAVNQGTSYIYQNNPQINLDIPEDKINDWSFFRYLVWDVARDPDGKGFWVLTANGSVLSYNARFWGQPGWWGKTGYRWKQGNFKEYIDIVKDMLCWSGFTYYDSNVENIKSWSTKTLASGAYEQVEDYTLLMRTDGNLVLGTGNFITVSSVQTLQNVVWESETDGNSGAYAVMQSDGNFVIYSTSGSPLFNTGTYGRSNAKLVLRYDGFFGVQTDVGADLWIGYAGSPDPNDRPSIYGNIESTGIFTDKDITGDKFDKRTIIDCINEIKQVVGYNFFIDQEGGARFESPNWWSAGNFDSYGDGQRIYVTYDEEGNYTRVSIGGATPTPGAEPFIPEINETVTLKQYQASIDGDSLRSEIIIGSDTPDPNNPRATSYVKFSPGSANDEIRPGVPALRNIIRPAIWIDNTFTDKEEQKLMAELINLQIWFSQRIGNVTCVANPNIEINDQIRIIERNTSETYIHYVRGISSNMDLDTGQYEMSLSTNWLGDQNDWVITSDNVYNPITHISISERVDRWQQVTGRGLQFSGLGVGEVTLTGGFN